MAIAEPAAADRHDHRSLCVCRTWGGGAQDENAPGAGAETRDGGESGISASRGNPARQNPVVGQWRLSAGHEADCQVARGLRITSQELNPAAVPQRTPPPASPAYRPARPGQAAD